MDEHIEAVQRMQDYIEAHLDANISMADVDWLEKILCRRLYTLNILEGAKY